MLSLRLIVGVQFLKWEMLIEYCNNDVKDAVINTIVVLMHIMKQAQLRRIISTITSATFLSN